MSGLTDGQWAVFVGFPLALLTTFVAALAVVGLLELCDQARHRLVKWWRQRGFDRLANRADERVGRWSRWW